MADSSDRTADLISICIPTFKRPQLLVEAVESCFAQAYRPLEIVIGDDSPDEHTKDAVAGIAAPEGITLRWFRNVPSLGQSGNVNRLFEEAAGARLMLLHDDDLLMPGGLDLLVAAWDAHDGVAAVYGKRYYVAADGKVLERETETGNRLDYKTGEHEGPQASAVVAALRKQFPNNGYLVRRDLARAVGYRPPEVVSDYYCDMDFGIRLGLAAEPLRFVYVDRYITKYRVHGDSVTGAGRTNTDGRLIYESLMALDIPPDYRVQCQDMYERIALRALRSYARNGDSRRALRVYGSALYRERRSSLRGLYDLATIIMPRLPDWRERLSVRLPGRL
jgi:glycosyltransferase involved in cell wall biosynthesis